MFQVGDQVLVLGWAKNGKVVEVVESRLYLVEYSQNGKVCRDEFTQNELCFAKWFI